MSRRRKPGARYDDGQRTRAGRRASPIRAPTGVLSQHDAVDLGQLARGALERAAHDDHAEKRAAPAESEVAVDQEDPLALAPAAVAASAACSGLGARMGQTL